MKWIKTIPFPHLVFIAILIVEILGSKPWEPSPKDSDWWMRRHQKFMKITQTRGKDIKVVFIGSSSMDYWDDAGKEIWESKYVPLGAVTYGIRGDKTEYVLWRIENGTLDGLSPKLFVVYVGGNNIPGNKEENVVKGINAVITKIHEKCPESNILYVSIFPSGTRPPLKESHLQKKRIADQLRPLIDGDKERKSHFFDDMFSILATEDMEGIHEQYYQEDKLHLNPDGYALWDRKMNDTFYSLLN